MIALPLLAALAALLAADGNSRVDPAEAEPGEVALWESADGLSYEYRLPEAYDPEVGANLVLVLHGNGLDHRWTFWNHPPQEFRTDDIVVSPDGTTPHAGTGANEFLQGTDDVERVLALLDELEALWNVRQVFLYGHSQGAFFVYWMAGLAPERVDGVVGHAGAVWIGTDLGKKGHHQAIAFLHGTDDHIPYGGAVYGRGMYEDEGYPRVHLRTLFGWNHRPHWYQAQQVLAWCEGTTSDDPARVVAAVEELADTERPMGVDWSALYEVATRLAELEGADERQRERGRELADAVAELAAEQLEEIVDGWGRKGPRELSKGAWSGALVRFREDFRGTPAWEDLEDDHGKDLARAAKAGAKAREDALEALEDGDARAVDHALALLEAGWLDPKVAGVLEKVETMLDAGEVKVARKKAAAFEEQAEIWREGREEGFREFERRNAKAKLPRP